MATHTVSEAQLAANRENAQHSTGPKTEEGKVRSSQNSISHGLFSKSLIIPGEDPAGFDALLDELRSDLRPSGAMEETLVFDIARARWRLARLAGWEHTAYEAKMYEAAEKADRPVEHCGTRAFRILSEETKLLPLFVRYESMFNRQINRALDTLRKIQREKREKNEQPRAERASVAGVQNEAISEPLDPPKPAPAAPRQQVRRSKKPPRPARRHGKAPPGGRKAR